MWSSLKTWAVLSVVFGLASGAIGISSSVLGQRSSCATPLVNTKTGSVCGLKGSGFEAFLGIPYGASTAGANRWKPPVPRAAWTNTLMATKFGNACPQNGTQRLPQSEDCLSLNVWTPKSGLSNRLPVLVFIHGGAFVTGSSGDPLPSQTNQALYDGAALATSQRIVVVTLNYRLGALGFLAGVNGLKGNYGFQDQQLALEWVRDNIAAFGGDAAKVTLSGESAGAMSVGLHLLSAPRSQNLFSATVMQSNPMGLPYKSLEQAKRTAEYFLLTAGCFYSLTPQKCLQDQPVQKILKAQQDPMLNVPMLEFGLSAVIQWAPVVDGETITTAPMSAAASSATLSKPMLMGVNANEGDLFVALAGTGPISDLMYRVALAKIFAGPALETVMQAYPSLGADNRKQMARIATDYFFLCANRKLALQTKLGVYAYQYKYSSKAVTLWPNLPDCLNKACHSDELPFTFNNLGTSKALSQDDRTMGQRMASYWGAFVRQQRPEAKSGPAWAKYQTPSEGTLEFAKTTRMTPMTPNACAMWDKIGYEPPAVSQP